jgi:hypothetical protein
VKTLLEIDKDEIARRRSVDFVLHLLHDCIPSIAFREAERRLHEAFENGGVELTPKVMRKEYEAWKSAAALISLPSADPH